MEKENTYKGLPLYKMTIDEEVDEHGVKVMSIVDLPAVQSDFLKFSAVQENFSMDDDKRVITGCALRANYPIYRKDDDGNEFYVTFTPDYIEKIVQKFMREGHIQSVNLMHDSDVTNVFLFESYLLTEAHKLSFEAFSDIEPGSWMVSYKVDNDGVWDMIKEGKLKGFSVEINAMLDDEVKLREEKYKEERIRKLSMMYYILKNGK